MYYKRIGLIISFFLILSISCSKKKLKIERAFYYWKSNYSILNENEWVCLDTLKIQKLYVKFFEVEKDSVFGNKPFAKSRLQLNYFNPNTIDSIFKMKIKVFEELQIIPVIFIKNEVFLSSTNKDLEILADNINYLINKYYQNGFSKGNSNFYEIQIDCDWTVKSKENYFYFLKELKKKSKKNISCTLRLYPYKYSNKLGVPPVNRVTLMCYNLTNFNENKNAIQDNYELELYLKETKNYPIPIDIALPAFSYVKAYQYNKFVRFINIENIDLNSIATPIDQMWYEIKKDIELDNIYLRIGDKIKIEEGSEKETKKTIKLLKKYVKLNDSTTIAFFNLSDEGIKKYTYETYNTFFKSFSSE